MASNQKPLTYTGDVPEINFDQSKEYTADTQEIIFSSEQHAIWADLFARASPCVHWMDCADCSSHTLCVPRSGISHFSFGSMRGNINGVWHKRARGLAVNPLPRCPWARGEESVK